MNMTKARKALAVLLSLMMVFSCVGTASADEGGSFYLSVTTDTSVLIEPVEVRYAAGQTVAEALLASGYRFEGLESGYISAIEGVAGNFSRYYDGGGYDLSRPAADITAIYFTEQLSWSEEMFALVKAMGAFRARTDHVQNYPAADTAYKAARRALRNADDAAAKQLREDLEAAIADYEALLNGPKYRVTVTASQGGQTVSGGTLRLTDAYGNVTEGQGTSASVIAGTYTFSVSDGGFDRTEGTVEVTGDTALSVTLPGGDWFGTTQILNADKEAYDAVQDAAAHTLRVRIPDTSGDHTTYLNAGIGDVPDRDTTRLRTIYTGTDGVDYSTAVRSWESTSTTMRFLVAEGLTGRSFTLEAQYPAADGTTQIQSLAVEIVRVPTLASLSVTAEGTALPLSFDPLTERYTLTTVSDTVEIAAEAFGTDGYTVSGTGTAAITGSTVRHDVTVTGANGESRTYTLSFEKKDAVSVRVTSASGASVTVLNAAGAEIAPVNGVYRLIPGEEYVCRSDVEGLYFAESAFTARDGLTVTAPAPEAKDAISAFALYNRSNASTRVAFEGSLSQADHSLTYTVPDANSSVYAQADALSGYTVTAHYLKQTTVSSTNGTPNAVVISNPVDAAGAAKALSYGLAKCGYSQTVTLRAERASGGVTYYQEYRMLLKRSESLQSLALQDSRGDLQLLNTAGEKVKFLRTITDYQVTVDRGETALTIGAQFINESTTSPVGGGYYALVNGVRYESLANVSVPLDTEKSAETLEIKVCHADENAVASTYRFTVNKTDPVRVTFETDPADAVVFLIDNATGRRITGENGVYSLVPGGSYTYTVTRSGYQGIREETYTAPEADTVLTLRLTAAPESTLPDYTAQWPSFRGDDQNNGIRNVKTPVKAEEAMLSWSTKLGEGYSGDACGCPILVDGYLYVYAQNWLYKVDTVSGEIVARGQMDHASSFGINTPTYADGMIFVGLSDGTVQAFNADTLESLWIYRDARKGQPNCPIVYHDGYIYTGFWLGETMEANYVCLSVTDEDPANAKEEKLPTWTYTSKGGFYWSGAYVSDDYMILGTDDGAAGYTTGHASVLSLDPKDGTLIDSLTLSETGDIRSSMTYVSGTCYFTTKGGYFYGLSVDAAGKLGTLRKLKLYNYASDAANPAMSTSTPTVYNGRAYIGVSGTSQFGAYSGHNITVIDLGSWDIAYTVRTQGYPQTSGLLTTAYAAETGSVNVYFFDNYTPGKLRMLTDRPGQTAPAETIVESYTTGGSTTSYETAYALFTPVGDDAQYAICSPIVDEYGNIYFKNDSARLMAITSTIERLELTAQPDKTSYAAGETFDPAGMKVTAVYTNGAARDVTDYVTWSEEALTVEDTEFEIRFPYVKYQNAEGEAGVPVAEPTVTVTLEIGGSAVQLGDVNGDGEITSLDAALAYAGYNGTFALTADQRRAADVNGDGEITSLDAALIYAYYNGAVTSFDDFRKN